MRSKRCTINFARPSIALLTEILALSCVRTVDVFEDMIAPDLIW